MSVGSGEEERIRNSMSRYTVRREEEIGARLSDNANMNSTKLVGNENGFARRGERSHFRWARGRARRERNRCREKEGHLSC